jgi:glyoxylase-like metal-dependent hydrolase (beta-lactamase superfamily II)
MSSAASRTSTCRTATRQADAREDRRHFDSTLHAPVTELLEIGQHAHVDVPLGSRHVDVNGIEVVPTPGHSPAARAT